MSKSCSRIVFWEPSLSPHKQDLFSSLAALSPDIDVICFANEGLSRDRQSQGWSVDALPSFLTIVSPNDADIDKLVSERIETTLHIFSGIRWVPSIIAGLIAVRRYRARFAIMSEPRVREGWKGMLRFFHSWLTETWLRRNVDFVLGQGRNGPAWFRLVGYPERFIFPFAYFVNSPSYKSPVNEVSYISNRPIQVGYAGRLVDVKGVFDLVSAVATLGYKAELKIVGAGPALQELRLQCLQSNVAVDFLGVLPIQEVGQFMRDLDVLVLASTSSDDGWGVVVSEALMCGTAVVATTCVGASIMLDEPLFGRCVLPRSPKLISDAICDLSTDGSFAPSKRYKRESLAKSRLSADAGAAYLLKIIRWRFEGGVRPVPFNNLPDIRS